MVSDHRVLFCNCEDAAIGDAGDRRAVREGLHARGIPFREVADLCRLAANREPALCELAAEGTLTIIACHPRAVRWMLDAAGIAVDESRLRLLDLRAMPAATILDAISDAAPSAIPATGNADDGWKPWFPVIDYTRCTHCRQCMSFCLFGVYTLSPAGKVQVANPRACKYNCPACARICPQVAIMFPKLADAESPLNGDAITDEQNLKARARINASDLLGDDLYAALALRRQQARKRLLKTQQERQADAERAACSACNACQKQPAPIDAQPPSPDIQRPTPNNL